MPAAAVKRSPTSTWLVLEAVVVDKNCTPPSMYRGSHTAVGLRSCRHCRIQEGDEAVWPLPSDPMLSPPDIEGGGRRGGIRQGRLTRGGRRGLHVEAGEAGMWSRRWPTRRGRQGRRRGQRVRMASASALARKVCRGEESWGDRRRVFQFFYMWWDLGRY